MFCFLYKIWISHILDNDKPLPALVKRHVIRCDRCRTVARQLSFVHQNLSLEAPISQRVFAVFLREKIMKTISNHKPAADVSMPEKPRRSLTHTMTFRLTTAAACLIIFWSVALNILTDTTPEPDPDMDITKVVPQMVAISQEIPVAQSLSSDIPQLQELIEAPITTELEMLQRDAENVTRSLLGCFTLGLVADNLPQK